MKIRYWGTAAAEGVPGVFCGCEVCKYARKNGGKNIRTRSQVMLDDKLLIDFNSDTYIHAIKYGFDLSKLSDVLITHVHFDHYYPVEFLNRKVGFAKDLPVKTLTVHGSSDVVKYCERELKAIDYDIKTIYDNERVRFDVITPYETREILGIKVTAIPASHGTDNPYVYIFEKGGKCMFLYNDSGYLDEEAVKFIKDKRFKFDLISYDCTLADDTEPNNWRGKSHMGLPEIFKMKEIFTANGNYTDKTISVITHFSHNLKGACYDKMLPIAEKNGLVLAYDGLELEF